MKPSAKRLKSTNILNLSEAMRGAEPIVKKPSARKVRKRKPVIGDGSGCNSLGNGNWICRGFFMRRPKGKKKP